jgi:hypothetical protein
VHGWSTFDARINHKHTHSHKTHHGLDLGETITFPLVVLFVINHGGYIQLSFCLGTPKLGISKFPKLGLSTLWRAIISFANLWLRWDLKQSCTPYQGFPMICGMPHARTFFKVITNFLWSGVKLALWFSSLLLAITCRFSTQWVMRAHFRHLCFKSFPIIQGNI